MVDFEDKAVFRVECGGEVGTAFLISSRLAVTAFHVVKKHQSNNIDLSNSSYSSSKALVIEYDENLDIAFLDVEGIPTSICPFQIGLVEKIEANTRWCSKGYPLGMQEEGEYILPNEGVVINQCLEKIIGKHDILLDLNLKWDDYSGLSGGPLVVNNFVVGILTSQKKERGKVKTIQGINIKHFESFLEKERINIIALDSHCNKKKHLIDSLPKHDSKTYFLRNDEEDIIKKLESNKFLQIYGPSGIGKSELSKSIASKMLGSFDDLIWVNGDYVNNRDFDFSSVYVSTYNSKVNVAASLENKKILLILDNFNDNALKIYREFISLNKKDSLCLMTSLQRNIPNNNTHSLSKLPYEISMSILQDTDIKPSCDIANKIIDYVDGYPLVLSVIRDSIEIDDISWEDTLSDIQSVVAKEDPDINTKIATRIIQRSQSQIDNELKWIYFLKSRFVSKEFLSAAIGTGVSNLKKRSIVTDSNSSFFTIHQMVLDSICYLYDDELINHEFIYDKLSGYIKVQNELKSVGYYNFLFMHDDFINLIYKKVDDNNELKMQLAYAMIQGRDQNKNCTWLKEIKKFELDVNSKISVLLFIERVEIELFEKGKENDNDSYKQLCDSKISDLESIISENSDADIDIYLKHHLGKLYVRSGNYEQAVKLFRYVIEKDSNADYARLQLARLSIWNNCALVKKQEVDECLEFILNRDTSWKELSLSVLLATYCLISERKAAKYRNKYIDSKIETFVSDLKYSLSSGFELPFELLSKLSSHLSYNHKEIYAEICEDLPLPSTIEENDKIKYSFATIQLAYYKHLKYNYNEPDKDVKKKRVFNLAKSYFESIDLSYFQRGKFVDLYIAVEQYEEALAELLKNSSMSTSEQDPFHYQKLCKTYRSLDGYIDLSIESIDKAIDLCSESDKNKKYLSAFLHDKALSVYLKSIHDAIPILSEAISLENNPKTKGSWNQKLAKWKSEL